MVDKDKNNPPRAPMGEIPEGAYGDCVKLFRAREYARARACFDAWLEEHPDDAEAHHLVARLGLHLNQDLEDAAERIRRAAELRPECAGRYFATLGEVFLHQGKYGEAETAFAYALEKGISNDPEGFAKHTVEFSLSICRKKLKAAHEFTGEPEKHPSVHGEEYSRLTESKRGGLFVVQSVVVHIIALVILSVISGMHGEVEPPEDFVYIEMAEPAPEPAGEQPGGGGEQAGQGEPGEQAGQGEEGALPGPVARSEGVAGPGRAESEARAAAVSGGTREGAERRAEGLKEAARLQAQWEADQLQARLDAERQEGGFEAPRPKFDIPQEMPRAGGLDIDTGEAETAAAREAVPGSLSDRGAAQRRAAEIEGRESGARGERGAASGRKAAAGIDAGTSRDERLAGMPSGGRKADAIGDIPSERPGMDTDIMPQRRQLGIDVGGASGPARADAGEAGELRSIDRGSTGPSAARVGAAGVSGASGSDRPAAGGGAKEVARIASAAGTGRADTTAPPARSSGRRGSDIGDVAVKGAGVDIPSDISRPAGLGISVPDTGTAPTGAPGAKGGTGAAGGPATIGERSGRSVVAGAGARPGSSATGGRGYEPSAPSGGKSVRGIGGAASSGDSLTVPVSPSAIGSPGGGGIAAVGPSGSGLDIPDAPVGGGGSLEGLAGSGTGTGSKPGGSASGTGASGSGTAEVATISGPGRKGPSGGTGRGTQAGQAGARGERSGDASGEGKGFAAGALGRPVGSGGQDKYGSSAGKEAKPRSGEKYASLGRGEKSRAGSGSRGPRVRIITPVSGKTGAMAQTVTGSVSGKDVTKATLSVNNDSRVISVADGRFSASVALFEGRNIVTVMAFDNEGNVGKDFVTLDYNTPETDMLVKITEPRDGQVFDLSDRSTVMVRGTVEDKGIRSAKLVLNGNPKDIVIENGRFEQEVALVQEMNTLFVEALAKDGAPATSGRVEFSTVNIKPKDLMVILTWDKPRADMDLHIYGPSGGHTFYKNPDRYSSNEAIAEGRLEQDAKDNYGPEVFVMEKAQPGEYTVKSNYYYSGGDGDAHATVTIILYGDNPARRIVRVFGPHLQVDTKTGEDFWEVARFKMPEGIFLEE